MDVGVGPNTSIPVGTEVSGTWPDAFFPLFTGCFAFLDGRVFDAEEDGKMLLLASFFIHKNSGKKKNQ